MVLKKGPPISQFMMMQKDRTLMSQPFLDEAIMEDKACNCSLQNFKQPRLRRCAFDPSMLSFVSRINQNRHSGLGTETMDGGLDGYNWKVRFGESGLFVLKILWDAKPPEPPHYFAAQRECQNAALFQMIQAAMLPDRAECGPILVHPSPVTQKQAWENLCAFSDERRCEANVHGSSASSLSPITSIPRLRECHGWMMITGDDLLRLLPAHIRPGPFKVDKVTRALQRGVSYIGLVYEYVDDAGNDPEIVQQVLDFLRSAGFARAMVMRACNWKDGVLVDLSDFVHPGGSGWSAKRCTYPLATDFLNQNSGKIGFHIETKGDTSKA